MDIACAAPLSARFRLRDACGEVHARLDARLSRVDFADSAAYADMLLRTVGPLTTLENALTAGAAPRLLPDWDDRRRSVALMDDLRALGVEAPAHNGAAIDDEAEAFGVLYVLEGSRLGGRVLARIAGESASPAVRNATRYFRHAEDAGHWRSFVDALERSGAVRDNPERAIGAALAAFTTFEAAYA